MSTSKAILQNTAIQSIGKVAVFLLSFISVALTARYLGIEGFGALTTITVIFSFISLFVDSGLFTLGVREYKDQADRLGYLSHIVSLKAAMALAVMVLTGIAAFFLPYPEIVQIGLILSLPSLLFNAMANAFAIHFQANLQMKYVALAELVAKALTVAAIPVVILLDLQVFGFVVINVLGSLVLAILTYYYLHRQKASVRFRVHAQTWRSLLLASIPFGIISILNTLYFKLDSLMLSFLDLSGTVVGPQLSNLEAVGYYAVPYRLIEILILFPGIFALSVLPALSAKQDRELFRRRLGDGVKLLLLAALPLTLFIALSAKAIILVIAGSEFLISADILRLLMVAVCISFANVLLGFGLVALGLERRILILSITSLTLNFVLNLIFIPLYSFYGAAATTIVGEAVAFVFSLFLLHRYGKVGVSFRYLPAAVLALVPAAALYLLIPKPDTTFVPVLMAVYTALGALFFGIYGGMLLLLRVIEPAQIKEILRQKRAPDAPK